MRYVIVGNGIAGITAAESIRSIDREGEILVISDEDVPFYYRIRLTEVLSGDMALQDIIARDANWYETNGITQLRGRKITGGDPQDRIVIDSNGEQYKYDRLLLANGSHSFVPPIQGAEHPGVFTLRNAADAERIIDYAQKCTDVVMIGGGLLGLEAGNALRRRGLKVTVVEFFPRLLPRQLDNKGALRLTAIMEEMGFRFRLGSITGQIEGSHGVDKLVLKDGEILAADMVVISAGVRPNLKLASRLGLRCDKGVKVDSKLRTSRENVYAAGDICEHEGTVYGIWPAALQQGRVAGRVMAGAEAEYNGTVMANKLKVVGIDLAAVGEIDAAEKYDSHVRDSESVYRKFVVDGDRLIGAILLGDTSGYGKIARAINEGTSWSQLDLM